MSPTPLPTGKSIISSCEGLGPFCALTKAADAVEAFKAFATIVSNIIGILTTVAGLWFLFQLLSGAFAWMSSSGDKAKLEEARNRITHALIGLIIVVLAIAIVGVVGSFLGLSILFNPQQLVKELSPVGVTPVPTK